MLPISDILIRSISGYVFIIPVLILYFFIRKKSGRKQSIFHIIAVFVFCYYLFGILTVTGIGYTSTISFRPQISIIPFCGMISGPIDTILNLVLFVPLGFFLPLLYKKYVIVWHIEQSGADTFSATYEVDQQIKEGEQTSNVKATYTVKVHVDADGDMVIVQNPTLAPAVEKSDYEPKTPEADASVDADTVNDATAFLETFFKLYPTATEKELAYYVLGNVIEPIGRDYLYSELVNPIFIKDGDNVKVKVAVKFIDNQTKATQVSQYELVLHKDSNWKIVG